MMIIDTPKMMLEGEEQEHLVAIINASLSVDKPHLFFSWSQGAVQRLLPHEILVCGIVAEAGASMRFHLFSACHHFRDEIFNAVCNPFNGLIARMMSYSRKTGRACIISMDDDTDDIEEWLPLLQRYGLENVAAHGLRGPDGLLKSYFCFFRIRPPVDPRIEYLLQMLLPFLETTLIRAVANIDRLEANASNPVFAPSVSARELEILGFIKIGMTNHEIATALELSPLTVKNHVQKTLRKLNASNRGHAVMCAIELGLLK